MSISNRSIKEGTYTINYENKFQTFLGKVVCLFKGHKRARIEAETGTFHFCISCWKQFENEENQDADI